MEFSTIGIQRPITIVLEEPHDVSLFILNGKGSVLDNGLVVGSNRSYLFGMKAYISNLG